MSIPGEWFRRLVYLVRRRAMEEELRREMEAHRAQMADPRVFGNALRLREEARDAWGWRWLDDLTQDVRFALRTLGRTPGFTLTAIVTLALGIGANSGMFSLVSGLLLRPLYERPDAVVSVVGRSTAAAGGFGGISYPNYLDIKDGTTAVFAALAAHRETFEGVDTGSGARRTMVARVTADYFDVLGRPLALGRTFSAADMQPGAAAVVVLGHALWERHDAPSDIVGRNIRVDGEPHTVIGVMARGFTGAGIPGPEVWLPLRNRNLIDRRDAHEFDVIGRLRDGVSREQAAAALTGVAAGLAQAFPAINGGQTLEPRAPSRLLFMPGAGAGIMRLLGVLLMLMPAVVLLVACLNLADLLLARGHLRRQELAIRASLGGSRSRLTRQLLTEGVLLSLAGGALGLWLSTSGTRALLAALHPVLPAALMLPEISVDWRVLALTMGVSLAASLIFGAWPAWALTGRAVVTDLKRQSGDAARRPGGIRVGNALVVAQVAFSLALLASAGLFLKSAIAATSADPGFRVDGGIFAEVDPGLAGYDEEEARAFQLALVDRVRTIPGVDSASLASAFPFTSFNDSRLVVAAGGGEKAVPVDAVFAVVGRDYARTLGLPMLGGRDFSDAEMTGAAGEPVAIIDDALAGRLWPNESPIGQSIRLRADDGPAFGRPHRVVGVMPALKHSLGTPRPFPHVYVPLGQHPDVSATTLQLRLVEGQDERAMLATIARVIREADDRVPVAGLAPCRDALNSGIGILIFRAAARVCAIFGVVALLLAVIGVYGVKSYVVSGRTREFGIRIATGAEPRALLWQVMLEGGRVTAAGIALGLVLAVGAGQLLQGLLYGVNRVEPVVLVLAPLVLFAASLLASVLPARRATRVDPTVALRAE